MTMHQEILPEEATGTPPGPAEAPPKKRQKRRPTPNPAKEFGLLTLPELSEALSLPLKWLRKQWKAGRLPCAKIGSRTFFAPEAVRETVQRLLSRCNQKGSRLY
jgi:hypothetical protein